MKILVAWIGTVDLDASRQNGGGESGPIARALEDRRFEHALLLANQDPIVVKKYVAWLRKRSSTKIEIEQVSLTSPIAYGEIYAEASKALMKYQNKLDDIAEFTFHLSPGTPAMAAVWILLSAKYPAELIESSIKHGVNTVNMPFDISAELLPEMLKPTDEQLNRLSTGLTPESYGEFAFRSPIMARLVKKAEKASQRSTPILIQGESGTGKTLLAHEIHKSGPRKKEVFEIFNCGAVLEDEVVTKLFGDFVGNRSKYVAGMIDSIGSGTLLLKDVEKLPIQAQIRLQTLTETGIYSNVGQEKRISEVRIIASTNSNLMDFVVDGSFREDLFYSLAVLVLKVPPLRERIGDLGALIGNLLEKINSQNQEKEPGYLLKKLSPSAKSFLLDQSWPGNLRELESTLRRATVWSDEEVISEATILDSILFRTEIDKTKETILGRPIEEGIDLQKIIGEVSRHYIKRAIESTEGNKSNAAKLLGFPSYQTISNWIKKYGLD